MIDSAAPCPFVFFAAIPYDHCLSGRTRRLAESLSARGHDVSFVELPSLRTAARRMVRPRRRRRDLRSPRVISLKPLPGYLRLRDSLLGSQWIRYAVRRLGAELPHLGDAVVVVSTPWWIPVLRELPRRVLCYDYIDHVSVHTPGRFEREFARWDAELLDACDLVTTVSEVLRHELLRRVGPERVVMVPNGVCEHWIGAQVRIVSRTRLAGDAARPVAGFLGAMFEWVDFDLMAQVAARLPQVTLAMVGPRRRGVHLNGLGHRANVRSFPAQPYCDVPRWIGAFDVCLIPFKDEPVAACADPVKLYEYLALGKPVVSTLPFGPPDTPIAVAAGAAAFAAAIGHALGDGERGHRQRMEFARQHTWTQRAADLVGATQRCLVQAPVTAD
jgi:glycosyltransferase involved in cell wall biosynthesis